MIDRSIISRIIDSAQIVEVIGEFVTLKRRGANYMACCPFHNEKTPSFSVSPSKGIYKCFGCGKAGNVVNFVMEHEQLSYIEALKYLGRKYGITVEEEEEGAEAQAHRLKHEAMMNSTAYAQKFYNNALWNTPMGKAVGLSYFRERGFTDSIIRTFQLGYAPNSRDAFSKAAISAGHPQDILVATGLSILKEATTDAPSHLVDRFYDRVLFPIHSLSGRVIAFGGRTLRTDKALAKYINSPESDVYSKSRSLYGLFFAKPSITRTQKCYLVEGYTDVISLFQAGIENVVASSGTSLTTDQIRYIKRFAPQVTVLYDGDAAGIKASLRGIDMLLEEGLQVKVVLFPDGEDPDSFARNHAPHTLLEFLTQSEQDFITFKTNLLLKEGGHDPLKRAQLINDVVHSISVIPDAITRTVYMEECARRFGVEEGVLVQEVAAQRRKRIFGAQEGISQPHRGIEGSDAKLLEASNIPVPSFITQTFCATAEKELIYYLLKYGQQTLFTFTDDLGKETLITIAQYITAELRNDDLEFQNLIYKAIFDEYGHIEQQISKEDKQSNLQDVSQADDLENQKYFINHPDIAVAEVALELLDESYPITIKHFRDTLIPEKEHLAKTVPKAVLIYKAKVTGEAYRSLCTQLEKAQGIQDQEQISTLMEQIRILLRIRNTFSRELKRLTL